MNTRITIICLITVFGLIKIASAQDEQDISQQEYEASIASFGVSQTDSAIASQEASRIAEELRQQDETDPMDSLPDNWLEGTPY
ncbi:MAG: hypothetical protein R3312_02310 [Gammaproteobacteria bacterium]|nr:hypothetical protein [Gammaproteobacteria bacterium]